MWVGSVYSTKNDIASIVKTTQDKTNYPVIVNNIIIYYATRPFDMERYKFTEKYKKIIQWCQYFEQQ